MTQKAQKNGKIQAALLALPAVFDAGLDQHVLRLCDVVREVAYSLHTYLGPGHLEKVYENGMMHRLHGLDVPAERQVKLDVRDEDGTVLGEYFADILVNRCLIVELKTAETIAKSHVAQLVGYLRATQIRHGLLLNFGSMPLGVRKFVR